MDLTFEMGWAGGLILVLGALVIGIAYQFIGEPAWDFEWIIGSLAALAGGFVASEYLGDISAQGPEFDGLYLVPALVGGVVVAAVVVGAIRLVRMATTPRAV